MGIKILSFQNQISQRGRQKTARRRSQKMTAAAAITIANSGVISRDEIVQTVQTLGSCHGCVFVYTFYTHGTENQYNVLLKILLDSTKLAKIREDETANAPLRHAREKKKIDEFIGYLRIFTVSMHSHFVLL